MSFADEIEYARVVYYGNYGTGKTTAMAHAAHLGTTLHIDAEQRLKPGPLRRMGVPVDRIERHSSPINYDMLLSLVDTARKRLHDQPGSVAAINLDSMTEICKILVTQVLEKNHNKIRARAARRGEDPGDLNPFQIDLDFWGEMSQQVRTLLRYLRGLDCHLAFSAHVRRDQDGDGQVSYGPATSPAVQQDLMGYADVVIHAYSHLGWFVGRTAPGTKYQAKDAFGVLPPVMANPTMDRIVAYVNEQLTAETDPIQQKYLEAMADATSTVGASATAEIGGRPRRRRLSTDGS